MWDIEDPCTDVVQSRPMYLRGTFKTPPSAPALLTGLWVPDDGERKHLQAVILAVLDSHTVLLWPGIKRICVIYQTSLAKYDILYLFLKDLFYLH